MKEWYSISTQRRACLPTAGGEAAERSTRHRTDITSPRPIPRRRFSARRNSSHRARTVDSILRTSPQLTNSSTRYQYRYHRHVLCRDVGSRRARDSSRRNASTTAYITLINKYNALYRNSPCKRSDVSMQRRACLPTAKSDPAKRAHGTAPISHHRRVLCRDVGGSRRATSTVG